MSRKLNYPGFCARYGLGKVMAGAFLTPLFLGEALNYGMGRTPATMMKLSLFCGFAGFSAAHKAHEKVNHYAAAHGYGLTRGGRLVRQWQAAAYTAAVTTGLTLQVALGSITTPPSAPAPAATSPHHP